MFIKQILHKLFNTLGYKVLRISNAKSDPFINFEFGNISKKCQEYTMTSVERMYALSEAVKYIIKFNIPGDFVECGVWRGGSAMIIAHTLLEIKETNRKIYLYDTFEGMSKPTEEDYLILQGDVYAIDEWKKSQKKNYNKWCFSSLSEVQKNMLSTKYPKEKLIFVKGKIEETIPKYIPEKIALLRLDTDFYESTKHELHYLFPLLVKNGVLIIDDYGHWAGSKKAVDEYFFNKAVFLNRIDYAGRIGIKTE